MASHPPDLAVATADATFWGQDSPEASVRGSISTASTDANSTTHSNTTSPTQDPTPPKSANSAAARASVPVACVACRSRHLKCDGGVRCSRCVSDGVECSYVKSRRGWKGKRKNKTPGNEVSQLSTSGSSNGALLPSPLDNTQNSEALQLPSPAYDFVLSSSAPTLNFSATTPPNPFAANGTPARPAQPINSAPANATGAFFAFFNSCHPFLLPRHRFVELLKQRRIPLLETAIQYIGSCFIPSAPTEMYKESLNRMLQREAIPKEGYSVQALILFAMGLHANAEPARAAQILQMALDLALEMGIHRAEFAIVHGNGDSVLEESWRRTWWSLYIINAMFAAVNPTVPFALKDVVSDVFLPCEDREYISGHIPFSRTIQEYEDEAFMDERITFSSFTYLIAAVRILGKILHVARTDPFDSQIIDMAEEELVTWSRLLPASKKSIVQHDGQVDELLFTARMIISGATIMLHRPRSNLGYGEVEAVTTCVDPAQVLIPTQSRDTHTARCLQAAEDIAKLIKLPGNLQRHTPMFTCVIVMSSVVHLSYWSFLVPDGQDEKIKSSIRLDIGALQTLTSLWPVSKCVLGQVRGVAHAMYTTKKSMTIHMWTQLASDDIIRQAIEDGAREDPATYRQLLTP